MLVLHCVKKIFRFSEHINILTIKETLCNEIFTVQFHSLILSTRIIAEVLIVTEMELDILGARSGTTLLLRKD